jgi:adhesin transport system membrane fusion protein
VKVTTSFRISSIWLGFIFLGVMLIWANFLEIDQAVHAQGSVTSSTRTQVIQVADGGVLEKLLVREGQSVKAGQLLAVLEKERATAGVDEGASRLAYLNVALIRAQAQTAQTPPDFSRIDKKFNNFVQEQQRLYAVKKRVFETDNDAMRAMLILAKDELSINEKLAQTGDVSQLDLIRARRQVSELEGKLAALQNKFISDAQEEAAKIMSDQDAQKYRLQEKQSILDHSDLLSPLDGVVKSLRVTTVGGVLRSGDEIMQISPSDEELVVEAKVNPADIGLLRLNLPIQIRVDAFDYTIYGGLTGSLTYISSDTLVEQQPSGQSSSSYRVQVRLDPKQVNPKLLVTDLKPGMTVGLDIMTGKRSVLSYVIKPITRAFQGAGAQK